MSFGNILGEMLQKGLAGQTKTRERLGTSTENLARSGEGIEPILAALRSALGQGDRAGGAQTLGGFAEGAKAFLGQPQAGGLTGAQIGGLGAVAGALLGGGVKGAARGGALAILATLALSALRQTEGGAAAGPGAGATSPPDADEIAALTSEEGERLALRAMIAAAKADGQISPEEMDRILAHLSAEDVTEAERRFVLEEVRKPLDVADIAREVRTPAQAAEVYAASLLAIDVDSEAERRHLRALAAALELEAGTVAYLHRTTGVPAP